MKKKQHNYFSANHLHSLNKTFQVGFDETLFFTTIWYYGSPTESFSKHITNTQWKA